MSFNAAYLCITPLSMQRSLQTCSIWYCFDGLFSTTLDTSSWGNTHQMITVPQGSRAITEDPEESFIKVPCDVEITARIHCMVFSVVFRPWRLYAGVDTHGGDPSPSGKSSRDQMGHPQAPWVAPDISVQTAEFHPSTTPAALSRCKPVITAWPQHRRPLPAIYVWPWGPTAQGWLDFISHSWTAAW